MPLHKVVTTHRKLVVAAPHRIMAKAVGGQLDGARQGMLGIRG